MVLFSKFSIIYLLYFSGNIFSAFCSLFLYKLILFNISLYSIATPLLSIKSSLFYNNFKDFNKKYIKEPWASVRLYLHNNKIYEYKSKIGQLTSTYIQKAQNLGSTAYLRVVY